MDKMDKKTDHGKKILSYLIAYKRRAYVIDAATGDCEECRFDEELFKQFPASCAPSVTSVENVSLQDIKPDVREALKKRMLEDEAKMPHIRAADGAEFLFRVGENGAIRFFTAYDTEAPAPEGGIRAALDALALINGGVS